MGDVNRRVIASLRELLEQRMETRFTISPKLGTLGPPGRSFKTVFVDDYYKWLAERIGEGNLQALLTQFNSGDASAMTTNIRSDFIRFVLKHYGEDGQKALKDFEEGLVSSEKNMQFDSSRILNELQAQFPPRGNSRVKGYLAITGEDIYAESSRFNFGSAGPGYGVMFFKRFTSAFNQEDQNRPRLLNRALKQALSSSNLILGIPRCSNPSCARAYPHSLPELDQKPDSLCDLCRERLNDYQKSVRSTAKKK